MEITSFFVRRRIGLTWIPALVLLAIIIFGHGWAAQRFGTAFEIGGFVLIGIGSLGRIWCGIYIAGRKNKVLCQDGPYSICRNPLYAFSFIGTIGVILGAQLPWAALVAIPLFLFYYRLVIRDEERTLLKLFGSEYGDYCSRVHRLWPRLSVYWTRDELTIQPRKVVSAIIDASWFLWMIILLESREHIAALFL